jgi:ElaB/YqjD/DUF883 family membrane-anchored ribosome-binding protein
LSPTDVSIQCLLEVPERRRKKKLKPWELVDDIRELTPTATLILQSFASVAQQDYIRLLRNLHKQLEQGQPTQIVLSDNELINLVKKCLQDDVDGVEMKYRQLLLSVQLALWMDQ